MGHPYRALWAMARRLGCILRSMASLKDGSPAAGNELQRNKGRSRDAGERPCVVIQVRDVGTRKS